MVDPKIQTSVRHPERTTDEKLDQLRNAVKRQAEASGEPVGIMVGSDNFLAQLGIGSLEGAPVIVHDGCTIISTVNDGMPDVPITGSRVWISTLDAVRETAGLDEDDTDWSYLDDDGESS